MRLLITCSLSLLIFSLTAQESTEWENHYHHYYGSYESDFPCKGLLSVSQRDSMEESYCGYLSLTLTREGTYSMILECYKNAAGKMEIDQCSFMGTYLVNGSGELILNGSHPFDTNKLQIKEGTSRYKGKKYFTSRGFKYRFNESYSWISKKGLYTFCDGCSFNPED